MLKIDGLTKYYGNIKGVENLSLEVNNGEIFGFIGPNGAGKSTTIRSIMGLLKVNAGNIYINNKLFNGQNEIKEIIGYLPSEINLYDNYTVINLIKYNNAFYKKDCMKKANNLLVKLKLDKNKKVDELSLGNLKKLAIILTLMHDPKLIIMDEATSGLDPLVQDTFYEILREEKQKGNTIFFSSHNLNEVKKLCDRIAIIKDGNLIEVKENDFINGNVLMVNIISDDVNKIIKDLDLDIKTKDNEIRFSYSEDMNKLLKILSKYNINNLTIEEPDIEEVFMHYYK